MKVRLLALGFVFGAATALMTNQVLSEEEGAGGKHEVDEMMQRWQQYALPGEHHKLLEKQVGEWEAETRHWMPGADEPSVNTVTVSNRLIFGDRFLETRMAGMMNFEHNGEMMQFPVEAIGYTGYDNFKERYVAVWIDSHNTGIFFCDNGIPDPAGSVVTYYSFWDDWETGQRNKPMKLVDRVVDQDYCVSEFYDLSRGENGTKVMEIRSKRTGD